MDEKGGLLLSLANEHNIRLWNVSPQSAYCAKCDIKYLLKLCERDEILIKIRREHSLSGFMQRSIGGILIGAMVICLFLAVCSGYVWDIEVSGCKENTKSEILAILEKHGLVIGAKKSRLPDGNTLRDSIIYSIDGVNWAWVYLDGTLARVEVSYTPPREPVALKGEPCNIIAVRDGVIVSVSATSGRKCAAVGQTVTAGELLLSGAMPGGPLTDPYQVAAEGEILAETVHSRTCTIPLTRSYFNDTGEVFISRSIRVFDLEIPLGFNKLPNFEQYRVEKHTPPVGLCTYRYIATENVTEQLSTEAAVAIAADSLSEEIAHSLTNAAKKTGEQLTYTQTGEFIRVTLTMNFIENIGVEAPVEVWQMEELANDKTD